MSNSFESRRVPIMSVGEVRAGLTDLSSAHPLYADDGLERGVSFNLEVRDQGALGGFEKLTTLFDGRQLVLPSRVEYRFFDVDGEQKVRVVVVDSAGEHIFDSDVSSEGVVFTAFELALEYYERLLSGERQERVRAVLGHSNGELLVPPAPGTLAVPERALAVGGGVQLAKPYRGKALQGESSADRNWRFWVDDNTGRVFRGGLGLVHPERVLDCVNSASVRRLLDAAHPEHPVSRYIVDNGQGRFFRLLVGEREVLWEIDAFSRECWVYGKGRKDRQTADTALSTTLNHLRLISHKGDNQPSNYWLNSNFDDALADFGLSVLRVQGLPVSFGESDLSRVGIAQVAFVFDPGDWKVGSRLGWGVMVEGFRPGILTGGSEVYVTRYPVILGEAGRVHFALSGAETMRVSWGGELIGVAGERLIAGALTVLFEKTSVGESLKGDLIETLTKNR